MAVDGYLNFNTKISTDGFNRGSDKIASKAKGTANDITRTVSKTDAKIQAILNDSERSNKSKAASIAAIYRKEGMNISEAMEKAWSQIERGSAESTNKVTKNTKMISASLSGLKPLLSKIAFAAATAFSIRGLVNFGKEAINIASDIQEVQNVVDVSFKHLKGQMEEFADKAIETYGISKLTAKQTGSTYMAMAKGMQIADEKAADMALTLTGLSADMASFYNKEQSVTSTALNSIFTGETETLKQFGIVMTEANLQQFAYTQGINKKISAMSQAEKVMLRYNYVMSQTALAQGDFADTQNNWANQTRIITEQWREFSGTIGAIFMNTLLPAVQNLNKAMLWLNSIASSVLETLSAIFDWDISSSGGGVETYEGISDAIGTSVENQNALTDAVKETAEAQKRELMGFDKINKLSDDSSSSSGGSATGATGGNNMAATMKLDADTTEAERELTGFVAKVKTAWESGDYEGLGSLFAEKVNSALDKFANEIDYEGVKEKIRPKIQGVASVFNSFVDGVDWSLLAEGISRGFALALGTVDITLDALDFEAIGGTVSEFLSGIDVPALGAELGSLLSTVFSGGIDLLSGFIQEIDWGKILFGLYDGIKNFFANIDWGEIAASIATNIGSMWGNLFELAFNATALIGTIGEDISNAFKNIGDYFGDSIEEAGGNIVLGIWNGITDALSNAGQWIKDNIFTPFIDGFKKAFGINSPSTVMAEQGGYLIDGLKNGIGDIWESVKEKFTGLLTGITKWFTEKKESIKEGWETFTSDIKDKKATITASVKNSLGKVGETVKGYWEKVTDKSAELTAKAKNKNSEVLSTLKSAWAKVKKKTSKLTGEAENKNKSVLSTLKDSWSAVKTKTSTLTAKAVENGKTKLADIKDKWQSIKTKTSELTVKLSDKLSTSFKTMIRNIIDYLNGWVDKINAVLPGSPVKKMDYPKWAAYKDGGFPTSGQIFIANEAGPELVGTIGGRTAVANNSQIVEAVAGGVYEANAEQNMLLREQNSILRHIYDKEVYSANTLSYRLRYISVPQTPKLATGTVVPANYGEFLAVLGDNKREPEIVSPESAIRKVVSEELNKNGGGAETINLVIELDGDVLYRTVVKKNKQNKNMTGVNELASA